MPPAPDRPLGKGEARSAQILALLHEEGPLRAQAVASALAVHLTTAIYHLERLAEKGTVVRQGRFWVLADADPARANEQTLPAGVLALLDLVRAQGPLDHTTAARLLGVSASTVTERAALLLGRGIVVSRREGRRRILEAPGAAPGTQKAGAMSGSGVQAPPDTLRKN